MKEICLKLTTKTAELRFQGKPGVFITYFKRIHLFTRISITDFEHEFTRRDVRLSNNSDEIFFAKIVNGLKSSAISATDNFIKFSQ